jgi:hypothetical protein
LSTRVSLLSYSAGTLRSGKYAKAFVGLLASATLGTLRTIYMETNVGQAGDLKFGGRENLGAKFIRT